MLLSEYVAADPTIGIQQERLPDPVAKVLEDEEVLRIYEAIALSKVMLRDRALFSVVMDDLAEKTGIDLHSHRGRHTFATNLIVKYELDPSLAMELTRHRDVTWNPHPPTPSPAGEGEQNPYFSCSPLLRERG